MGITEYDLTAFGVAVPIRVIEQPQLIFRLKHPAAGCIDCFLAAASGAYGIGECYQPGRNHIHIKTGFEALDSRVFLGSTYPVIAKLLQAAVVGYDKTLEAPLVAQQVGQEPLVACSGHTMHGIESRHDGTCSGINGSLVGLQVLVEHMEIIRIDIVVLSSGFDCSVEGEMLDARHHRSRVGDVCTLVSAHHRFGYTATQIGILAAAFGDTSPAPVMAYIDHGRECPAYTVSRRLRCRYLCRTLDCFHIPRTGQSQGDGKDRLIAVNHIHTEEQWNSQTALLDSDALHLADGLCAFEVEQSAHLACAYIFGDVALAGSTGDDIAGNGQVELPEFLLERHLRHEVIDKALHLRIFVATRGGTAE